MPPLISDFYIEVNDVVGDTFFVFGDKEMNITISVASHADASLFKQLVLYGIATIPCALRDRKEVARYHIEKIRDAFSTVTCYLCKYDASDSLLVHTDLYVSTPVRLLLELQFRCCPESLLIRPD